MNKVFAILLMFLLGALGFILHCVQGVLMVAWIARHGDRPPLSWVENTIYYVTRNLFNENA